MTSDFLTAIIINDSPLSLAPDFPQRIFFYWKKVPPNFLTNKLGLLITFVFCFQSILGYYKTRKICKPWCYNHFYYVRKCYPKCKLENTLVKYSRNCCASVCVLIKTDTRSINKSMYFLFISGYYKYYYHYRGRKYRKRICKNNCRRIRKRRRICKRKCKLQNVSQDNNQN